MKKKSKIGFILGGGFVLLFAIWTVLILCVDVQPVGQNGTNIGFASLNTEFHHWTGVHLSIYTFR